jgi:hypothetical protein
MYVITLVDRPLLVLPCCLLERFAQYFPNVWQIGALSAGGTYCNNEVCVSVCLFACMALTFREQAP